jgi:hypothetical protein
MVTSGSVVSSSFELVGAISLEGINVLRTADLAGTTVDPTGQAAGQPTLSVEFAFPVFSGSVLAPAEPSVWYPGRWILGTTSRGYVAQCLVGPNGCVATLTAGTTYDVWCQIVAAGSEYPVKFTGQLRVY